MKLPMEGFLISSQPPASPDEIEAIERECEVVFPPSYKEFLMANNGGLAESDDRRFSDAVFFTVADTPNSLSSEISERRNKSRIPIGTNLAGTYLSIDGTSGAVFLGKAKVADNFESFVRNYLVKVEQ